MSMSALVFDHRSNAPPNDTHWPRLRYALSRGFVVEGPTMKVDLVLKLGDRKFAQALDQEVDADDSLRLDAPISREELHRAADDDGNVHLTAIVRKGER